MSARRALTWLLLYCLGLGCATTAAPLRPIVVVPPQPPATHYTTETASGPFVTGDLADAARQGLAKATAQGALALTPDSRLATLAHFVADYFRTYDEPPSGATLNFVAHHLGLPEPAPRLAFLKASAGAITEQLSREITQLARDEPSNLIGLYAEQGRLFSLSTAVVVLSSRHLTLEPVPRSLTQGATLTLRGTLTDGYRRPILVVAPPNGQAIRKSLGDSAKFATALSLSQAGQYGIELLGEGEYGPVVLANFPVFVGVAVPDRFQTHSNAQETRTPLELAERIRELTNSARQQAGLPPLQMDDQLTAVASDHNQDMIDHDFVGHTSPTTGGVSDRLLQIGLHPRFVGENIGLDYSADDLQQEWMNSPGHRENVLRPAVTHMGIDVRIQKAGDDGPPQILATVIFIQRAGPD